MGSRLESNSERVRKRIEEHEFNNEEGDEYGESAFGGFPEYFRRKKIKLQNLDNETRKASDNPAIFRGIVAHITGYTQPSLADLHKLIVSHGGGYIQYLDGKTMVTHIVAGSLTPKKKIEFRKYRMVKPAWIVDSVKARRLLPWTEYRVADEGEKQNRLAFQDGKVVSQPAAVGGGYRDQTDASYYTRQFEKEAIEQSKPGYVPKPGRLPETYFDPQLFLREDRQSQLYLQEGKPSRPPQRAIHIDPVEDKAYGSSSSIKKDVPVDEESTQSSLDPLPEFKPGPLKKGQRNEPKTHPRLVQPAAQGEGAKSDPTHQINLPEPPEVDDPTLSSIPQEALSLNVGQPSQTSTEPTSSVEAQLTPVESYRAIQPDNWVKRLPKKYAPIPEQIISPSEAGDSSQTDKNDTENRDTEGDDAPQQRGSSNSKVKEQSPKLAQNNLKRLRSRSPELPAKKELTPEEHNAILLKDERIWKSSVANPNFLKQYYAESRLHHLSTWKADLRAQMQALANERTASQKIRAKIKRKPGSRRYIFHVDFDCFFAAVSLKKRPELKEKPCIVAHGSGTGSEIASCNYVARKFGIKNGMWTKKALELCKDLTVLPYDFPAYEEASKQFYEAMADLEGVVESVSIDEALVDVTDLCLSTESDDKQDNRQGSTWREEDKANEIAQNLRTEVKARTGCEVSIGIGGSILLAKLALRKAKPAGQHQIKPDDVLHFIGELGIRDLPGVAWSIGGKLEDAGIKFIKDVRGLSKGKLIELLGPKTGEKIWDYAKGIDKTEVGTLVARQSVSTEINWGIRFVKQAEAEEFIRKLCEEVENRLRAVNCKGSQLMFSIMVKAADAPLDPPKHLGHGKCDTHNKTAKFGVATCYAEIMAREAVSMLRQWNFSPGLLRGLGIHMHKLVPLKEQVGLTQAVSQPKLQFKAKNAISKGGVEIDDPIDDGSDDFRQQKQAEPNTSTTTSKKKSDDKPLNLMGTQFIMPTQTDPSVLEMLPNDIRLKLTRPQRQTTLKSRPRSPVTAGPSRKQPPVAYDVLPSQSQLDPEFLAALPEDIRAEVLAEYRSAPLLPPPPPPSPPLPRPVIAGPSKPRPRPRTSTAYDILPPESELDPEILKALPADMREEILAEYKLSKPKIITRQAQSLLPQSPRKSRTITMPKPKTTPSKLRKTTRAPPRRSMLTGKGKGKAKSDFMTLTQTNFVQLPEHLQHLRRNVIPKPPELEFLAALPDDMQQELLDQYKRDKVWYDRKTRFDKPWFPRPDIPWTGRPPPKCHFGPPGQCFWRVQDVKKVLKNWYRQSVREDGGPAPQDVGDLCKYLDLVVKQEQDMAKARLLVVFIDWWIQLKRPKLLRLGEIGEIFADEWDDTILMCKESVEDAIHDRTEGFVKWDDDFESEDSDVGSGYSSEAEQDSFLLPSDDSQNLATEDSFLEEMAHRFDSPVEYSDSDYESDSDWSEGGFFEPPSPVSLRSGYSSDSEESYLEGLYLLEDKYVHREPPDPFA